MKIIRHYHIDDTLQRSVVQTPNGVMYRRIVRWVTPEGELSETNIPEEPVWQMRDPRSKEFFIVSAVLAKGLEKQFIDAIIKDNQQ